jgi:hypothetical protein
MRVKEDQAGIALIAIVVLLLFLSIVAISEMLVITGTQLQQTNEEIAIGYAEQTAIAATSPVRSAIDDEVYQEVGKVLRDHLVKDQKARLQRPGTAASVYTCQGPVDTSNTKLSETWAICEPQTMLNSPNPFINQTTPQTINDLAQLLPAQATGTSTPGNPYNINTQSAINEIKRETANQFTYTVRIVYIGQEVVRPGVPRRANRPPVPRIERYRWLARAELTTRTYENVHYPLVVNYDVVTTVTVYDEALDCPSGVRGFQGFSGFPLKTLTICTDPGISTDPNSTACNQTMTTVSIPNAANSYGITCGTAGTDNCLAEAKAKCSQEAIDAGLCRLSNGGAFQSAVNNNQTYNSNGCSGIGQNGYVWSTAIRIVGIGTKHN